METRITTAIAVLCLAVFSLMAAPAAARELLDPASWQARPAALARNLAENERLPRDVKRWRSVDVHMDVLTLARTPGAEVEITLFDDAAFKLVVDKVAVRAADDVSLTGRVSGARQSMVNIVNRGAVVLMDIWTLEQGTYHVRFAGGGLHVVREIDPTVKGQCGLDDDQVTADAAAAATQIPQQAAESTAHANGAPISRGGSTAIDVLIVYTPAAMVEQGGATAIEALAQLAVDGANQIYANSLSSAQLNLIEVEMVDYTESAGENMSALRDSLRDTEEGVLDEVHAWRAQLGADLVGLICSDQVDTSGQFGIAYITASDNPGNGFNVTKANAATAPNWSFAHEVGHNNGARHDHADLNDCPSAGASCGSGAPDGSADEPPSATDHASYSWGHFWDVSGFCETSTGHTLMARLSNDGPRATFLSNPNLVFEINDFPPLCSPIVTALGVPEGQPNAADNARTHTERRPIMAAWVGEPEELYIDFSCPSPSSQWWICSLADGLDRVKNGGTLRIVAGSTSDTLTITKPVTLTTTGSGSVVIGN